MKILYDHQIFTIQQLGGISRYFSELIKELNKSNGIDVCTSVKYSENKYLYKLDSHGKNSLFPKISFRGKAQIQNFLNRFSSQRIVRKAEFDLFHPTYYNPYFLSDIGRKPVVVTVYDMIHERLPHYFSKGAKISENKKMVIQRADKIIAISKHTKRDLIDLFGVKEEKIDVIYLGNSLDNNDQDMDVGLDWLPQKFILFVGIRSAYKNFQKFLESISPLFREDNDLHLVCIGGGGFQAMEQDFLENHDLKERILQISCSDVELAHIYKNALCYVFPSLYEGFGLPILEAFSANCPVVCSNCTSLPEIADDAAVYFDPKSENEIRESVKKVIYDDSLREDLAQKGAKRLEKFSWKETARQTKEIYELLV